MTETVAQMASPKMKRKGHPQTPKQRDISQYNLALGTTARIKQNAIALTKLKVMTPEDLHTISVICERTKQIIYQNRSIAMVPDIL